MNRIAVEVWRFLNTLVFFYVGYLISTGYLQWLHLLLMLWAAALPFWFWLTTEVEETC